MSRATFPLFSLDLFAPAAVPVEEIEPPTGVPPSLNGQLDLFLHSEVEQALVRARSALQRLALEEVRVELAYIRTQGTGLENFVADVECCVEAIERRDPRWRDARSAVDWIESTLRPAAQRVLANHATVPVHQALRGLLAQADCGRFNEANQHTHRSWLLHQLGDHRRAIDVIETEANWMTNEAALSWHAELCRADRRHSAELADIAELCFAFPVRAEIEIPKNSILAGHWDDFCELDPALPIHAFPAWCRLLHARPFLCPDSADARPGGILLALAAELASTRNANLATRKALHAKAPQLLAAWLRRREG